MQRGRKGYTPERQQASGETRPSRVATNLYADVFSTGDEEITPPPRMTASALAIWHEKVAKYKARGQRIVGFESILRIYCEAEAALLHGFATNTYSVAMLNAYRSYANEFFDTPASQRVKASTVERPGNQFIMNGKRKPAND